MAGGIPACAVFLILDLYFFWVWHYSLFCGRANSGLVSINLHSDSGIDPHANEIAAYLIATEYALLALVTDWAGEADRGARGNNCADGGGGGLRRAGEGAEGEGRGR